MEPPSGRGSEKARVQGRVDPEPVFLWTVLRSPVALLGRFIDERDLVVSTVDFLIDVPLEVLEAFLLGPVPAYYTSCFEPNPGPTSSLEF